MPFITSLAGANAAATTTTKEHTLGTVALGTDGTEWVYCISSGAITQFQAVGINEDFDAYSLTTALAAQSDKIGFAQVAFGAGEYGWVATRGTNIKVRTKASAAADAQLWTTASAGVLDDATAAAALKIDGIVLVAAAGTAANGAAGIEVKAAWPAIRET
jgi:hypothetical protein